MLAFTMSNDINFILLLSSLSVLYFLTFRFNPHRKINSSLKKEIKFLETRIHGLNNINLRSTRVLEWVERINGDVTYISPTFELSILLPNGLTQNDIVNDSIDKAFPDKPEIAELLMGLSVKARQNLSRCASINDIALLTQIHYNVYKEVIGPDIKGEHFILTRAYISSWKSSDKSL